MTASIIAATCSVFKPIEALWLQEIYTNRISQDFGKPLTGIMVEQRVNKLGQPLLGATVKPKLSG